MHNLGELTALVTAVCWTATSLLFTEAGKKIGSLHLNFIRLVAAFAFFLVYLAVVGEEPVPVSAPARVWVIMGLSGLVGFVFGDFFLFKAFILIGARFSMLVYSSVPVIALALGAVFLGEGIDLVQFSGVALTLAGISTVVRFRHRPPQEPDPQRLLGERRTFFRGVGFALLGALGQAGGLVIGRIGAGTEFSAFAATQIRVIAGLAGFLIILVASGSLKSLPASLKIPRAMGFTVAGAFFGPFLGVSLGLRAAQLTTTGIAATLMAIVPVLVIVPSVILYRERITVLEILGTLVTIGGVAVLV